MKTKYTLLVYLILLSIVLSACGGAGSVSQPSVTRIGWNSRTRFAQHRSGMAAASLYNL